MLSDSDPPTPDLKSPYPLSASGGSDAADRGGAGEFVADRLDNRGSTPLIEQVAEKPGKFSATVLGDARATGVAAVELTCSGA